MSAGRPPLDISEKIRRRIWYWNVITRSKLHHYALDVKFDIATNAESERKSKGNRRRKLFDNLRDKDLMPFRGKHEEFVNHVDAYPSLHGTANLYMSPFWDLVSKRPIKIQKFREFVLLCLRRNGLLEKAGALDDISETTKAIESFRPTSLADMAQFHLDQYLEALDAVLDQTPENLDILAMLGALFREAYYAGHLRIAIILESYYMNMLERIVKSDWVPENARRELLELGISRLLTPYLMKPGDQGDSYHQLLNSTENKGSAAGLLLARQDRFLWGG